MTAESEQPGGQPRPGPPARPAKRDTPWTLIIIGIAALYALIVAVLNSERVTIDFLFFSANVRLLFLVFLCVGLGFVVGFFFDRWRERRKRSEDA